MRALRSSSDLGQTAEHVAIARGLQGPARTRPPTASAARCRPCPWCVLPPHLQGVSTGKNGETRPRGHATRGVRGRRCRTFVGTGDHHRRRSNPGEPASASGSQVQSGDQLRPPVLGECVKTTTVDTAERGRSPLGAHIRFLMDGPHGNMIHSTVPSGMVGRACHSGASTSTGTSSRVRERSGAGRKMATRVSPDSSPVCVSISRSARRSSTAAPAALPSSSLARPYRRGLATMRPS
jgi:hypothetical protein